MSPAGISKSEYPIFIQGKALPHKIQQTIARIQTMEVFLNLCSMFCSFLVFLLLILNHKGMVLSIKKDGRSVTVRKYINMVEWLFLSFSYIGGAAYKEKHACKGQENYVL